MEIILLEHVNKLGKMGEKVTVKTGYARNYLLPQKKALRANAVNLALYEARKAELEASNTALFDKASLRADELKGYKVVMIRQAAETGQLYGSVSIRDVHAAMKDANINIERRFVVLERPIKHLGVYPIEISLHPEVKQTILVNIARTDDDAKKQDNDFSQE